MEPFLFVNEAPDQAKRTLHPEQYFQELCSEHTVVAWVKDEPCNFDEHSAPFSVKFVLRGRESYYSGTRKYIVTPERLLILDEGRKYSSLTHQDHPSELLSIFFHPSFVKKSSRRF